LSAAPYDLLVAGKFSDGLSSNRSPMRYRIARGMKDANDRRRHIIQKDTNFMTLLRHQPKGHGRGLPQAPSDNPLYPSSQPRSGNCLRKLKHVLF
jgi:hypothetical protein